jgi:hypothetical protein
MPTTNDDHIKTLGIEHVVSRETMMVRTG